MNEMNVSGSLTAAAAEGGGLDLREDARGKAGSLPSAPAFLEARRGAAGAFLLRRAAD